MKNLLTSGYRCADLHVRLGSLLHKDEFYYAEKLFVHSYYAESYAYLIFQHLQEDVIPRLAARTSASITLLGYGAYSGLLLASLRAFIANGTSIQCNLTTVESYEGLKFENENVIATAQNILIVVPVASTLTSTRKIQRKLRGYQKASNILNPTIVCLLTSPPHELVASSYAFWRVTRGNEIETPDGISAKYFTWMPSSWSEPQVCESCFPAKSQVDSDLMWLANEVPLHETDMASVSPSAVLSLPISKQASLARLRNGRGGKTLLTAADIVGIQHIVRGLNHFSFYIDTESLFHRNEQKVSIWLSDLAKSGFNNLKRPVVLVAPRHGSNAEFANAVNDVMFQGVATLIHHDIGGDFRTNLRLFYREAFAFNPLVVLVDDSVSSGATIQKLKEVVEFVFGHHQERFDVITLLDRCPHWVERDDAFEIHSFIALNVPPRRGENHCHLCAQVRLFEDLSKRASFDLRLRTYFRQQVKILSGHEYSRIDPQLLRNEKRESYKNRIEIIDGLIATLHDILALEKPLAEGIIEQAIASFIVKRYRIDQAGTGLLDLKNVFHSLGPEAKIDILKSLAYPSLSLYKNLVRITSQLLIEELLRFLQERMSVSDPSNAKLFRTLLKLVGKLKLNVLLRSEVIELFSTFIQSLPISVGFAKVNANGTQLALASEENREEMQAELAMKYVAAVKESIYNDEGKSYRLACELKRVSDSEFVRLLVFENNTILLRSLDKILNIVGDLYRKRREEFPRLVNLTGTLDMLANLEKTASRVLEFIEISLENDTDNRFIFLRHLAATEVLRGTEPLTTATRRNNRVSMDRSSILASFRQLLNLCFFLKVYQDEAISLPEKLTLIGSMLCKMLHGNTWFVSIPRTYAKPIESIERDVVIVESNNEHVKKLDIDSEWLTGRMWDSLKKADWSTKTYMIFPFEDDSLPFNSGSLPSELEVHNHAYSRICVFACTDSTPSRELSHADTGFSNHAVFTFLSDDADAFEPFDLQCMAAANDLLSTFIRNNFENDNFTELIRTTESQRRSLSMNHRIERYLSHVITSRREMSDALDAVLNINKVLIEGVGLSGPGTVQTLALPPTAGSAPTYKVMMDQLTMIMREKREWDERSTFYMDLLMNRLKFSRLHSEIVEGKVKDIAGGLNQNQFYKKKVSLFKLQDQIKAILERINKDENTGSIDHDGYPKFETDDETVEVYESLLVDVAKELLFNVGHARVEGDLHNPKVVIGLSCPSGAQPFMRIHSIGTGIDSTRLRTFRRRHYLGHHGGIAMIAALWEVSFGTQLSINSVKDEFFEITVPMPTLERSVTHAT